MPTTKRYITENLVRILVYLSLILIETDTFIFWDIKVCSLVQANRGWGGTCHHPQCTKTPAWSRQQSSAPFFLGLLFDSESGGDIFLRKVSWLSQDLTKFYPRRQPLWDHRLLLTEVLHGFHMPLHENAEKEAWRRPDSLSKFVYTHYS
jgi:hypothetical protein